MKKYKHYKGNIYIFIGIALHTETNEELVLYKDENNKMFARPVNMFFEEIEVNGKKIARFQEI